MRTRPSLSQWSDEKEFLIPQTQVQLTKFEQKNGKQYFEASLVSDLGFAMKGEFSSMVMENGLTALKHANPEIIVDLVARHELAPNIAVELFSDNEAIILAAFKCHSESIKQADEETISRLIREGTLPSVVREGVRILQDEIPDESLSEGHILKRGLPQRLETELEESRAAKQSDWPRMKDTEKAGPNVSRVTQKNQELKATLKSVKGAEKGEEQLIADAHSVFGGSRK